MTNYDFIPPGLLEHLPKSPGTTHLPIKAYHNIKYRLPEEYVEYISLKAEILGISDSDYLCRLIKRDISSEGVLDDVNYLYEETDLSKGQRSDEFEDLFGEYEEENIEYSSIASNYDIPEGLVLINGVVVKAKEGKSSEDDLGLM